jgi:beta-lactamase class A
MVVSTSVSGVRGRHSARPPGAPVRAVLAVLGACLVIAAGMVAALTAAGSGSHPPARAGAIGTGSDRAGGRLNMTTSASALFPVTASAPLPYSRAAPVAGAAAGAGRRDPFGTVAASYLSGRAGTVLAAVYDVGTGQTWHLGQGQPQAAASVVKLDVLETLLAEQGQGGVTGLPAGDRSLTEEMIEDSDNAAATSLWYQVGGAASIRSFNAKAGLTDTAPSSCVVCPGFSWPGWGLTTTTPDDQIALLRQLVAPSSVLTSAERGYALSLLEDVTPTQRWGVCAGVPAQVTVALKNGWLPLQGTDGDWQINSVGWVSGGGRNYLMAVLTTGNPTEQYGIDTINQLAAMVWQDMR